MRLSRRPSPSVFSPRLPDARATAACRERPAWDADASRPKARRIPWQGGKITSNKDEALVKFLKRKQERGEQLTEAQKAALVLAAKGTKLEGGSEDAVLKAAEAAPEPEPELPSKADILGGAAARGNGTKAKGKRRPGQQGQGQQPKGKGPAKKKPLIRKLAQPKNLKLRKVPDLAKRLDQGLSSGR